ncbi:MAG: hypothetical protein GXP29_12755, partial [Planctomycetes bacterium]|nr:hypothetical protein [Planctomycetota bacterium]
IDRHDEAIALLSDFESKHPDNADLMGRVLRVRIIAFESTGRLEEAEQAVPRFAASDPAEAAATLQTLLDSLRKEITRLRADGLTAQADKKAKAALLFARQIYDSATGQNASQESTYLLGVQLAEANLEAGQPEAALSLFRKAEALDKTRYGDGKPHDPRLVLGLAESMARLDKHLDALALFNRLFIESPVDSPHRYPAFLGDIRCRTALGEDAAAIIDVIEQHRFLDPELGGELTKRGILEIKAKNEKRLGRR